MYPVAGYGMICREQGMKFNALVLTAVVGALLLPAWATRVDAAEPAVKAASKDDLIAASAAVHKQMVPGGRYEFVTPAERDVVDAKLGDMQSLFDKYGTVATMNQDSKIQLFNDQESVNAILTNRDGDRRICKSVAPTGSLIPKTTCHTYGEIERSHRDSQKYLQDNLLHMPQLKHGG